MKLLPRVVVHNSVSVDCSLTGFSVDMGVHYSIAGSFKHEARLIGSNTIKIGSRMYGPVPNEESSDFVKQERDKNLPYWVIVDSKGSLKGLLHTCRRFEYCRDVIVLVSKKTPESYLNHLKERNYDYHVVGDEKVDLRRALKLLSDKYNVKTILTDTGSVLSNLLISQGLVNEVSVLVHPEIVGEKSYNMFSNIKGNIKLVLYKKEFLEKGLVHLVYRIKK